MSLEYGIIDDASLNAWTAMMQGKTLVTTIHNIELYGYDDDCPTFVQAVLDLCVDSNESHLHHHVHVVHTYMQKAWWILCESLQTTTMVRGLTINNSRINDCGAIVRSVCQAMMHNTSVRTLTLAYVKSLKPYWVTTALVSLLKMSSSLESVELNNLEMECIPLFDAMRDMSSLTSFTHHTMKKVRSEDAHMADLINRALCLERLDIYAHGFFDERVIADAVAMHPGLTHLVVESRDIECWYTVLAIHDSLYHVVLDHTIGKMDVNDPVCDVLSMNPTLTWLNVDHRISLPTIFEMVKIFQRDSSLSCLSFVSSGGYVDVVLNMQLDQHHHVCDRKPDLWHGDERYVVRHLHQLHIVCCV